MKAPGRNFVAKARFGYYRTSIPKSCRKKLTKIVGEGLYIENEKNYKLTNLIILSQFKTLLQVCKINGGYKKYFKHWFWVNHDFKYFPKNGARRLYFGGLPNFITSASLVKIDNVEIFPNKYSGNFRQKYTFYLKSSESREHDLESLITFNIGGAQSFQHFMQDCLPIIAQSKSFLLDNLDVPILLPEPNKNFKNRNYFFEKLKITNTIIGSNSIQSLRVKRLYFWNFLPFNAQYCLPPRFYKNLRSELTSSSALSKKRTILLFIRNEKTRNFKNQLQVVELLKTLAHRYNLSVEVLNTSESSVEITTQAVKQARVIVGVHGGSMYNAIFCSTDCTVIEIIPTSKTNSTLHYLAFSGITYIPFPCKFDFYDHFVDVPIGTLGQVIARVLSEH